MTRWQFVWNCSYSDSSCNLWLYIERQSPRRPCDSRSVPNTRIHFKWVSLFNHLYHPQMKFAKVMFLHMSVSHSVHRGGLPQCMLGYPPPRSRHTHPREQAHLSWQQTPRSRYRPPPQGAGTPQGVEPPGAGTHPPGADLTGAGNPPPGRRACWEIRSMRGRYASYWNGILWNFIFPKRSVYWQFHNKVREILWKMAEVQNKTGSKRWIAVHPIRFVASSIYFAGSSKLRGSNKARKYIKFNLVVKALNLVRLWRTTEIGNR